MLDQSARQRDRPTVCEQEAGAPLCAVGLEPESNTVSEGVVVHVARPPRGHRRAATGGGTKHRMKSYRNSQNSVAHEERGNVSEEAYRRLRSGILRGEIPIGTVLAENGLAKELGISRTPVRHALQLLLQEDLVSVGPRRQIIVRGVSPAERREIFLVREALERISVAEACRTISIDDIDQLRLLLIRQKRAAESQDADVFIDLDEQFHLGIAAGAKLPIVVKFLEQLRAFIRLMGIKAVVSNEKRMEEVLKEHEEIADAIESRDEKAALAALTQHLHATDHLLKAAEKQ